MLVRVQVSWLERCRPVASGQRSSIFRHPAEVDRGRGPAVPSIKVGEEEAAEAEVPPWLQAGDARRRADAEHRQIVDNHGAAIPTAAVGAGALLPEALQAEGAVGCDGNALRLL